MSIGKKIKDHTKILKIVLTSINEIKNPSYQHCLMGSCSRIILGRFYTFNYNIN